MSLIVATSKLNENSVPIDSEKPSSFTNFFRSPIIIEPNSEIAVESVKLERSGNITVGNRDFLCHYWGADPDTYDGPPYDYLTSFSRTIALDRGTYTLDSYINHLQSKFNGQYADPRIYESTAVALHTNASGLENGLSMTFTDKGSASGTDVKDQLVAHNLFNIANPSQLELGTVAPSSNYTWTAGTGVLLHTGTTLTSIQDSRSVAQLTGRPFGLNEGRFDITVKPASAQPFAIGLSRPQVQWETHESESQLNYEDREINYIDSNTGALKYQDSAIMDYTADQTEGIIEGPYEAYDYVFIHDNDGNITIAHRVLDSDPEEDEGQVSRLQEIDYWTNGIGGGTKLTYADFNATYEGIRFQAVGDEIELYFKQNGKAVYDKCVSSTLSTTVGQVFNPIGDTSYALYPTIHLGTGSVTITKYESNYDDDTTYKFPTYVAGEEGGYTPGSDMFSNESVFAYDALVPERIHYVSGRQLASSEAAQVVLRADSSIWKGDRFSIEDEGITDYQFVGLNTALGVDWKHILTINPMESDNDYYTLVPAQHWPNMGGRLGFNDRADIASTSDEGYVSGDDTLAVKFTSPSELLKTALSSFIRIPGLTHKSFNGAQSSLSKIVYHVPQFTNDGRQFGALYFSPGEKTYISLHNPTPIMLNSLQVQIVDSQEKEMDSLTGTTQVVFHIRKR